MLSRCYAELVGENIPVISFYICGRCDMWASLDSIIGKLAVSTDDLSWEFIWLPGPLIDRVVKLNRSRVSPKPLVWVWSGLVFIISTELDRCLMEFRAATCLRRWLTVWSRNSGSALTMLDEKLCICLSSLGRCRSFMLMFSGSNCSIHATIWPCYLSKYLYFYCFSVSVSCLDTIDCLMSSSRTVLTCMICLCMISMLFICDSVSVLFVFSARTALRSSWEAFELSCWSSDILMSAFGSPDFLDPNPRAVEPYYASKWACMRSVSMLELPPWSLF